MTNSFSLLSSHNLCRYIGVVHCWNLLYECSKGCPGSPNSSRNAAISSRRSHPVMFVFGLSLCLSSVMMWSIPSLFQSDGIPRPRAVVGACAILCGNFF
jgi:hypothetical protein